MKLCEGTSVQLAPTTGATFNNNVLSECSIIVLSPVAAGFTITGFVAPIVTAGFDWFASGDGITTRQPLLLINASGQTLTFAHQNVGSAATNRITTSTASSVNVTSGQSASLIYDGYNSTWRILSISP